MSRRQISKGPTISRRISGNLPFRMIWRVCRRLPPAPPRLPLSVAQPPVGCQPPRRSRRFHVFGACRAATHLCAPIDRSGAPCKTSATMGALPIWESRRQLQGNPATDAETGRHHGAAPAFNSLLEVDLRASRLELLLDVLGFRLGNTFLDRLGSTFDQRLGLAEAEVGDRTHFLDDVDLVVAE